MNRYEIIHRIGNEFHIGNTEKGEFSYVQVFLASIKSSVWNSKNTAPFSLNLTP